MPLNRARWAQLWNAAVAHPSRQDPFPDLAARYDEPHRHYHTAAHITACLALFDEIRPAVDDPVSLELALWFHDAVYQPRAGDNEERSADLATAALLACGGEAARVDRVKALILATKTHEPADVPDAPWMLDIDLAVLGSPPERFAAYDAAIHEEYAWVESTEYRARRAQVLATFLARPHIYQTPAFRDRFEQAARRNLQRTIAHLTVSVRRSTSQIVLDGDHLGLLMVTICKHRWSPFACG